MHLLTADALLGAVDEVRNEWLVSIRRACGLEFDRSTYDYKSRPYGQAPLEQKIKEICHARVRYGYCPVYVLLRHEGWRHGQNKTRRVYHELGLQLGNKTPQRRLKAKSQARDAIQRDLGDGLRP